MVKEIIREANMKTKENKQILLLVFLFVSMLEMIKEFSIQLGVLGIFFMILLAAVDHGTVVAGLKVTGQKEEPINPPADGFCGLQRLKELFSTYIAMDLMTSVLVFFVLLVVGMIAFNTSNAAFWQSLIDQIISEKQYGISDTVNQFVNVLALVIVVVSILCNFIVDWLFFMAPYELEMTHQRGFKALKGAWEKGIGHRREIFLLLLHYAWIGLVFSCLDYLTMVYISNYLLSSIASMVVFIVGIYCYKMEYAVAKALLYQRLSLRKEDVRDCFN